MKCPACEGTGIIHFRNIHEICGKCKGIGFIDEEPKTKKTKDRARMVTNSRHGTIGGMISRTHRLCKLLLQERLMQ